MVLLCVSMSSLPCIQRLFSEMKLDNQTNLENQLHISTESRKGFNDTVFQHFVEELKHCNLDMPIDLQLLVSEFLCLYSIYLVAMLYFRMIFFINCFDLFLFLMNLQYSSPLLQDLFAIFNEIFHNKLFVLVLLNIIPDFLDYI